MMAAIYHGQTMPIQDRFCVNHPDRPALGVCVITHKAICGECSTRYEGVNYSREGLKILQERRLAAAKRRSPRQTILAIAIGLCTPGLLYLVYLAFTIGADYLINMIFRES
jgi:hypothetical protein